MPQLLVAYQLIDQHEVNKGLNVGVFLKGGVGEISYKQSILKILHCLSDIFHLRFVVQFRFSDHDGQFEMIGLELVLFVRSEERRVGKECRSRWWRLR